MRFEIPYTSVAPLMRSESLGFARVVDRRRAGYTVDVTLIDTPDHRLLRSGVVLAHRVIAGLGEWYFAAPGWEPWLPAEDTEQLDADAEMPQRMAHRVRPLARRGVLGPVAALCCERSEYCLTGTDDLLWARFRDDKVTIRRGGVTTARYREVSVFPVVTLSSPQREFIRASMEACAATIVESFPTLQQRIGAPATGLSDFPSPEPVDKHADLEHFVSTLFASGLMELLEHLLGSSAELPVDATELSDDLMRIRRDIRGLSSVLDPEWFQQLDHLTRPTAGETIRAVQQRAIDVVDALVAAVRAPRLGDSSQQEARHLLFERAHQATVEFTQGAQKLTAESASVDFAGVRMAAETALTRARVASYVLGKTGGKLVSMLEIMVFELEECFSDEEDPDLDGLGVHEAFELGVTSEQRRSRLAKNRTDFLDVLPERIARLRVLLAKVAKKL